MAKLHTKYKTPYKPFALSHSEVPCPWCPGDQPRSGDRADVLVAQSLTLPRVLSHFSRHPDTAGVLQAASCSHWGGVRFKLTKGQRSHARLLAPRGFSTLAASICPHLSPSILTSEVSELVQEWASWPGRSKSSEEQGTLWYGRERKMWSDFCLCHLMTM